MPAFNSRLSVFIRVSLLALLMVGVALKPMLGSLCETHALAHVPSIHGHQHDVAGDHDHESPASHQMDRDHAGGSHGLLHEGDQGGAYADIAVAIVIPAAPYGRTLVGTPPAAAVSQQHLTGPFRPPIA